LTEEGLNLSGVLPSQDSKFFAKPLQDPSLLPVTLCRDAPSLSVPKWPFYIHINRIYNPPKRTLLKKKLSVTGKI
jgi:hypothetical protein